MSRPRGFITWNPQKKTQAKLDAVIGVLDEYRDYLPLTIRQIYYRLIGTDVIAKTENEYANLCELLNRARRAGKIDMDSIRDDGFTGGMGTRLGYTGAGEFISEVAASAEDYISDRQAGQRQRIIIQCEAGGMVPQLSSAVAEWGVTVKSSGGFDSLTVKHSMGQLWGRQSTLVLHIGDYDPSGECMFDALSEDVTAFAEHYGNEIEFIRLAVKPDQIKKFNLPTAPPKTSTHQLKKQMAFTVQAEALDPATLADIVRKAVISRIDLGIYEATLASEATERDRLMEWVTYG